MFVESYLEYFVNYQWSVRSCNVAKSQKAKKSDNHDVKRGKNSPSYGPLILDDRDS